MAEPAWVTFTREQLREEIKLISTLQRCNLKHEFKDIDDIRTDLVKENLNKHFFDANFMAKLYCVLDTVLLLPTAEEGGYKDASLHITEIFHDLRRIGADSVNGDAMIASFGPWKDLFIIKAPKRIENDDLFHEFFVGVSTTNNMRKFTPNYSYIFGGFKCLPPSIGADKKVIEWCSRSINTHSYVNYVIYEFVPGSDMEAEMATCTFEEYFGWIVQVLIAVQLGVDKYGFTHYDLHSGNVRLRNWGDVHEFAIPYDLGNGTTWHVKAKKIAVMIDFGSSHVEVNGRHFGQFQFEKYGIMPNQSRPLVDGFKLITHSMAQMKRKNNMTCYRQAMPLFQLFLDQNFELGDAELDSMIQKEGDTYYMFSAERLESEDTFDLWNYLGLMEKQFPRLWKQTVIIGEPGIPILHCGDFCPTPGQFETELSVDSATVIKQGYKSIDRDPRSSISQMAISSMKTNVSTLRKELTREYDRLEAQLSILTTLNVDAVPSVLTSEQFAEFIQKYIESNVDFKENLSTFMNRVAILENHYKRQNINATVEEFSFGQELNGWKRKYKSIHNKLNRIFVSAPDLEMQKYISTMMLDYST